MSTKPHPDDLRNALDQFNGTDQVYFNPLYRAMKYTDGVKYFAEAAGAYWFLDICGTELMNLHKTEEFLNVVLTVTDITAMIDADDGDGNPLFHKPIEFTDCPAGTWMFYLENNTLCLPGER